MVAKFDFSGWATRNDLRCSDGRTIRKDAFKDNDGQTVPLVWQHRHDDPTNVLGHALLENREEGVYTYCTFNDTEWGQHAKALVEHGDVTALSIYANHLKQRGGDVLHGAIKEVSLVLSGANPGAYIDFPVLLHSDGTDEYLEDEATIFSGEEGLVLSHARSYDEDEDDDEDYEKETDAVKNAENERTVKDVFDEFDDEQKQVVYYMIGQALEEAKKNSDEDEDEEEEEEDDEEMSHEDSDDGDDGDYDDDGEYEDDEDYDEDEDEDEDDDDASVEEVFDTLTDEQKEVVYFMIGKAVEDAENDAMEHFDFGGDYNMKYNVFDYQSAPEGAFLSHADEEMIIEAAKKGGSLRQAMEDFAEENELMHDDEPASAEDVLRGVSGFDSYPVTPGTGVDALFPEFHDVRPGAPELVTNDIAWVKAVLAKVHKSPYSRIRTSQVDIRGIEEIRARGYAKGKEKALAGQYAVAKRATDPQTVYVKSALNRDDIVDITDFDYVDYQYKIDRMQLENVLARAILIGDGKEISDEGKISEDHIRSIWNDANLYTIHKVLDVSGTPNGANTGDNFGEGYLYAQAMESALLDAKIDYRGTGSADMFCQQQFFNKMLLAKDMNGRRLYNNKNELASALDVANIYNVPEFANQTRTVNGHTYKLLAIVGNLGDYSLGATKGGEITHFNQFDIDFNQEKSLIETRVSGATTRIYSFIVIEEEVVANPTQAGQ